MPRCGSRRSLIAVTPRVALLLLATGLLAAACRPARGGTGGAPVWPDTLPDAAATAAPRGLVPLRAAIHLHSVYSHDACDGEPVDDGGRPNERCLARLRRAICSARLDAVFLTEHDRRLADADSLRDALLFREGDEPVTSGGRVVAKRQPCPGGRAALWFAGAENTLMPIAFDSLPRGTTLEKRRFYDMAGPGAADSFRTLGAVVLLSHPEDHATARAIELDPDGIEVYNPHANFAPKHRQAQGMSRLGGFARLVPFYARTTRAHPDLALLSIFRANHHAIATWDAILARRMVIGFGASDAHENALPWPLADGDRGDAYRRMAMWVTNILLVDRDDPAAARTPEAIVEAVRGGRFYTAIEAWGTPVGFDFRLESPAGTAEMGETVMRAPGQILVVELPRVSLRGLDPRAEPALAEPLIRARVLRVDPAGRRTIVAQSGETIRVRVEKAGAYRVEIGIVPRHLAPYLGKDPGTRELAWIYSNPIRVVE